MGPVYRILSALVCAAMLLGCDRPCDIHAASRSGSLDTVLECLNSDPTVVGLRDGDGNTPLNYAVGYQHASVVKALLQAGADPDAVCNVGLAPLWNAVMLGDDTIVQHLIKSGAAINITNPHGLGLLHIAADGLGSRDLCRLLLEHGVDLHARDIEGTTALHIAAGDNNSDVVSFLLSEGADPLALNEHGETPADWARERGSDEALALLIDQ